MARKYYTLCKFDTERGEWFDEFGSYSLCEVHDERDGAKADGTQAWQLAIITSDGTTHNMIAKRELLAIPTKWKAPRVWTTPCGWLAVEGGAA